MAVRLEHANLTVRDIEGMIRFLQTASPEFRARGEGKSRDGSRWVHMGTDETYIALSRANAKPESGIPPDVSGFRNVTVSERLVGITPNLARDLQ